MIENNGSSGPRKRRRWCVPGLFIRDQRGATAVEFAVVAAPFFALMFAILETCLAFWNQQVLETAVSNAARQIYTGAFQQDAANASKSNAQLGTEFKTRLCAQVLGMFDCTSMIVIDVRAAASFPGGVATPVTTNPTTGVKTFDTTGWTYQQPQQSAVVVVRAAMEYPTFVDRLSATFTNGKRLIMASATFRAEPFGLAPVPTN